ncbi:wings apart-like protein homolog isoform X2 [Varroa jacobsoni]|uniref:WAPL domain-containing protein n=1 Tax=Varroa destructor TaxID=109461 RepID=A0A7M7M8P8_VARDE|nr:wings apart-like protein homolog isoform X2 [Varroa destructor]XP_022706032.1 wings apart-like protein homolog isoform X2 [Varroa jacobsoni]
MMQHGDNHFIKSPLSSVLSNKSTSSSPLPGVDSPTPSPRETGSPTTESFLSASYGGNHHLTGVATNDHRSVAIPTGGATTADHTPDLPDDPPSSFGRKAPVRSYGRKRNAPQPAEDAADAKEARTETQHVEYENPLLKKLTSQPESRASIDMVTSEGPEASKKDEVKEEKPVAGTDRSKKTFFKSKNKTDPAAAKAKAVSRYKLFNFTGEDEEFGPGGDQESSVPEAFTKKDDGYSVTDKDLFEGDFTEPENKQESGKSYATVRNVLKAYKVHEIGEAQEFNDDVEYLLESVTQANSLASRCLSVCSLAHKCMSAQFRVHLRAHGVMAKFFGSVKDAPKHPSLALCVSALFFVLSQDRLTMDLEASTLAILLQLFEIGEAAGEGKHAEKVLNLCTQMRSKGHAKHLDMARVSASGLALETLLSLTSRRAGEWFKEELRIQGGLTHLINLVTQTMNQLEMPNWGVMDDPRADQLDKLKKIERVLRVLENVTFVNPANQDYLIKFRGGTVLDFCADLFNLCFENIEFHQVLDVSDPSAPEGQSITVALQKADGPGPVFLSVLLSLLKVMLNVTHENDESSGNWGSRDRTMRQLLECMLHLPASLDSELRFDLQLLALGLTINISEHSTVMREWLLTSSVRVSTTDSNSSVSNLSKRSNAFSAMVELFKEKQEAAAASENQTDAILDNQEEKTKQQEMKRFEERQAGSNGSAQGEKDKDAADDLEETIRKAIQKAGKHMEHSIISAYLALMLGCVIQGHAERTATLKEINGGNLQSFAQALKKFHDFIDMTGVLGNSAPQSIERILKVLETS